MVSKYIAKMYEYSKALVRTAAGTASSVVRRGFKQGGRFPTTAAKLCLMEINGGLRDKHEGVDAGPWLGTILDMEYGDDEMLLSPTGPKSKRLAEDFTDRATHRGMGVQGKKIAARKFGGNTTSLTNIGKDKV